jgi:hypothetical protein
MTNYSKNTKIFFSKNGPYPKSINHYDKIGRLHGEQRSWWDRNHQYPKELSVYIHGNLKNYISWHFNGYINTYININDTDKLISSYYTNGHLKYSHKYVLHNINKTWKKNGSWCGFYRNGVQQYKELYMMDVLLHKEKYYTTGDLLYKSTEANIVNSDDDETLTEYVFEELEIDSAIKESLIFKNIE